MATRSRPAEKPAAKRLATPRDAEVFLERAGVALRYTGKSVPLASIRAACGPEDDDESLERSITLTNHLLGTALAIEVSVIAGRVVLVHRTLFPALYALVRRGRPLDAVDGLSLHARTALRLVRERREVSVGDVRHAIGTASNVRDDPARDALGELQAALLVDRGPFIMPGRGIPYLPKEGYPYHLVHAAHADLVAQAAKLTKPSLDAATDMFLGRCLSGGLAVPPRRLASLFALFLSRPEIDASLVRLGMA